jgi:hypothetical protein
MTETIQKWASELEIGDLLVVDANGANGAAVVEEVIDLMPAMVRGGLGVAVFTETDTDPAPLPMTFCDSVTVALDA